MSESMGDYISESLGDFVGIRRPEINEWRYYRLEVWPDLFGRALLVRHWGRIGTPGRVRLDPHADQGAAINALAGIVRVKCRRGYGPR